MKVVSRTGLGCRVVCLRGSGGSARSFFSTFRASLSASVSFSLPSSAHLTRLPSPHPHSFTLPHPPLCALLPSSSHSPPLLLPPPPPYLASSPSNAPQVPVSNPLHHLYLPAELAHPTFPLDPVLGRVQNVQQYLASAADVQTIIGQFQVSDWQGLAQTAKSGPVRSRSALSLRSDRPTTDNARPRDRRITPQGQPVTSSSAHSPSASASSPSGPRTTRRLKFLISSTVPFRSRLTMPSPHTRCVCVSTSALWFPATLLTVFVWRALHRRISVSRRSTLLARYQTIAHRSSGLSTTAPPATSRTTRMVDSCSSAHTLARSRMFATGLDWLPTRSAASRRMFRIAYCLQKSVHTCL